MRLLDLNDGLRTNRTAGFVGKLHVVLEMVLVAAIAINLSGCGSTETDTESQDEPTAEVEETAEVESTDGEAEQLDDEEPEAQGDTEEQTVSVELTGSGTIDGDFLIISGTATNLPDNSLVEMTTTDSAGYSETLHPYVRDGKFEVPISLLGLEPGPVQVVVSVETDEGGYAQVTTGALTTSGELAIEDGPLVISEPLIFTVDR